MMKKAEKVLAEDAESDCTPAANPSPIAREVSELQRDLLRAVAKRERIPQPTFWYLFRDRLNNIRRKKQLKRALDQVFQTESLD